MDVIAAPFVHSRRKSRWAPSDVDASIRRGIVAMRSCPSPTAIFHEDEVVGIVSGDPSGRWSDFVPLSNKQWCGFGGYQDIKTAMTTGHCNRVYFRRDTTGSTINSWWFDSWGCAGTGQLAVGGYTGSANTARQFDNTTAGGLYLGRNTPGGGETRHIVSWGLSHIGAVCARQYILYDRVLSYESVSVSSTLATFTNTLAATRYISAGDWGLMVSVSCQSALGATASNLSSLTFTDDQGNTGVSLSVSTLPLAYSVGNSSPSTTFGAEICLPTTGADSRAYMPWLPLGGTIQGVRKLESITSSASNLGSLCLALIRPLATMWVHTNNITHTLELPRSMFTLARVYDNACLAFLFQQQSSNSVAVQGYIDFAQK